MRLASWGTAGKSFIELGQLGEFSKIHQHFSNNDSPLQIRFAPSFFVSFKFFLPSQGLPAWMLRYLFCCALIRTPSSLSISLGGISLKSFYRHTASSLSRSRPTRSSLSGPSSMSDSLSRSSSYDLWLLLWAREASTSMAEDCIAVSEVWFLSVEVEAGVRIRVDLEGEAEGCGGGTGVEG